MAQFGTQPDQDLPLLDAKLKQLRNEYEQYFLGSRKREPYLLRSEVQKMISFYTNVPLQNTALRFRFNNLRSRFFTFRRYWDGTLRKIEEGRYERHLFKARLKERAADAGRPARGSGAGRGEAEDPDLFETYVAARQACGQGTQGLEPDRLQALLEQQEAAIRARTGCERVEFRVVVEGGKARLKAKPVRS